MHVHLYLDTETTGLGPTDCAYQVAWQFEVGSSLGQMMNAYIQLPEDLPVSEYTLASHAYRNYLAAPYRYEPADFWGMLREQIGRFQGPDGRNVYLVGANPSFDDRMLRKMQRGIAPGYHHRMIDVEAYDMGLRRAAEPRGLADIARDVLPGCIEQEHEAMSDVRMLVEVYRALQLRPDMGIIREDDGTITLDELQAQILRDYKTQTNR
jgi:hypothetical protein